MPYFTLEDTIGNNIKYRRYANFFFTESPLTAIVETISRRILFGFLYALFALHYAFVCFDFFMLQLRLFRSNP